VGEPRVLTHAAKVIRTTFRDRRTRMGGGCGVLLTQDPENDFFDRLIFDGQASAELARSSNRFRLGTTSRVLCRWKLKADVA
jgi:hypothetical protein